MPTSKLEAAPKILNLLWEARQRHRGQFRVLDIGPGWGKYGVLVHEYVDPEAYLGAVEAWHPYIGDHHLEALYDLVIAGDILEQPDEVLAAFDAALLIDVIEHLEKPDAYRLLERLPGWVIVCTPRDFFDNPPGPWTETHRSHWTLEDFQGLSRFDAYAPVELASLGAIIVRLRPLG